MRLHDYMAAKLQPIMEEWMRRLRHSFAPESMPKPDLYDSVPVFLQQIAEALEQGTGRRENSSEGGAARLPTRSPIAREHGEQRLRLGFDASSLVREYFTLRTTILELARSAGVDVSPQETEILTHCIATGVTDAVLEYSKQRDEMFQKQASKHVGFLAHELRNALSASNLALSMLERSNPLRESRGLQIVRRNLSRAGELVSSALLDASLKGKAELRVEEVNLRAIFEELVAESAADEKNVAVLLELDGSPTIQGDWRLLQSALSNLIHNAVKFTREGGRVKVQTRAAEDRMVIEVEDECGGLPEGTLEKLFDPFVQSNKDRSGFGLGLAISKQAVEAHGGAIRVHNLPGKGCVFALELPQQQLPA